VFSPDLVGQSDAHLCELAYGEALGARVHREVVAPLERLCDSAREAGFELTVLSGFRDFDRQRSIWNRKVGGELAVLDSRAEPIDIAALTPRELVWAILRWSALPGASRHHWGTDVDVYDSAATPDGYEVQLIPGEVDPGGMHAPLHAWLDERIASGTSFGFYRPYDLDRGGVAPERWHLSYAPVSAEYERRLTPEVLSATIAGADLRLKNVVLEHLPELFERFVTNVGRPDVLT
jgi:LAS superfamily LD-carboxypeptidase LdcB